MSEDNFCVPELVALVTFLPGIMLGNNAIACCTLLQHRSDGEQTCIATATGGKLRHAGRDVCLG